MSYKKNIKIFKIKENINLPLAESIDRCAKCSIGDFLVCFDGNEVYVKDWNNPSDAQFSLLANKLNFFEINKSIFEPVYTD